MDLVSILGSIPVWATAVISSGGAVGGVVYSTLEAQLLYRIGFPWTVRLIALLIFSTLVPVNWILRPRKGQGIPYTEPVMWRKRKIYLEGQFLLFWVGMGALLCGIYSVFYYDIAMALDTGSTWEKACVMLVAFNAGNFPGRFVPLIPSTSLSTLTITTTCAFLGAGLLYLGIMTSYSGTVFVAVVYGMAVGGIQSLYSGVVGKECAGCKERLRLVLQVSGLGCLIGPPIGGALSLPEHARAWLGTQVFAGTVVLLGAIAWAAGLRLGKRGVRLVV